MADKPQRVVIVGRDAAAWLAAVAVQRALGRRGVSVTVLELPSHLADSDAYSAVPSLLTFHQLLGIDTERVIDACQGVPMVAERFANWARTAPPFLLAYDGVKSEAGEPEFLHYWLKAHNQGLRVPLEEFSLAAAAAKQGRIPSSARVTVPYGYQFGANEYAGLLKHLSIASGIEHRSGQIRQAKIDGDQLQTVAWDDGEEYSADLFIDASGAEGVLIRWMPGAAFESWREWLPCDHSISASAPALSPLPAYSQCSAFRGGWVGVHPLQGRVAVTGAFARNETLDETLMSLPILAGVKVAGDVVLRPFEAGLRPMPWIGNCVAIGAAAARLDPIDSLELHFLYICVARLMGDFPLEGLTGKHSEVYNAEITAHAASLRDFQSAHYRLNRRFDEPFWDRARTAAGPPSLDARLAAFRDSGKVALGDGETLSEASWAAMLVGHGLIPDRHDPAVNCKSDAEHMELIQKLLRDIAATVVAMPGVDQFLAERQISRMARS